MWNWKVTAYLNLRYITNFLKNFFTKKKQHTQKKKKKKWKKEKSIPHKVSWIYKRTKIFEGSNQSQQTRKATNPKKAKQNYLSQQISLK